MDLARVIRLAALPLKVGLAALTAASQVVRQELSQWLPAPVMPAPETASPGRSPMPDPDGPGVEDRP